MHHRPKRKSVFKIIFLKVLTTIVIFNIVLAGILMKQTMDIQRQAQEIRIRMLRSEIIELFKYTSSTMPYLRDIFLQNQELIFQELVELDKRKDLADVDLHKLLTNIGLDPGFYEIHIIKNDIIINSNRQHSVGNEIYNARELREVFKNLSPEDKGYIHNEFLIDEVSKRLKSVSYRITPGKEYGIELGSYTQIGDAMMRMFIRRLDSIEAGNPDIVSANVWIKHKNIISIGDDSFKNEFCDSILEESFSQKKDFHEEFNVGKDYFIGHFLYLPPEETSFRDKQVVITIINNVTDYVIPIRDILHRQILFTLIILFIIAGIIFITTRDYRLMLKDILVKTNLIANGNFSERVHEKGNNQFTTLAEDFNKMVEKLEISYNELNEKNKLINERNEELRQQNEEIAAQRDEIESQRDEIEVQRNFAIDQKEIIEKQKNEMLDSITYAKRIQEAALPHQYYVDEILPDNFIFFKPRDIVSGDFYWIKQVNEYIIVVAADCTGHGVPGAIMSILGISLLNEIVQHKKIVQPNLILNEMRKQIKRSLRQSGKRNEAKDGMDVAICSVNTKTNILQYAGAFNPLVMIRNGEVLEWKGDRMPIGIHMKEKPTFTNHEIELEPGDTMYVFSDGYSDQLGGEEGKKFMLKNLKNVFLKIHEKPLNEQKEYLDQVLRSWITNESQLDDILIVGFRII